MTETNVSSCLNLNFGKTFLILAAMVASAERRCLQRFYIPPPPHIAKSLPTGNQAFPVQRKYSFTQHSTVMLHNSLYMQEYRQMLWQMYDL